MNDWNEDTGGTSQRRGVHGDPWRPVDDPGRLETISDEKLQASPGLVAWVMFSAGVFVGMIIAAILIMLPL